MMKISLFLSLIACASAFQAAFKSARTSSLSMKGGDLPAIFLTGFPEGGIDAATAGKTAPVSNFAGGLVGADVEAGEFDPLDLSAGVTDETLQWYRAAELKHGRVCMLASLGILTAAIWQILTAIGAVEVSALFFGPQDAEAGDYGR